MEKNFVNENTVKNVIYQVLSEETSKVRREEYARLQFKIEELQNSLNETMKEFRKMEDSVPGGLKTICNGRVSALSNSLTSAQKLISQLKEKIKIHKRNTYNNQQVEEKKK